MLDMKRRSLLTTLLLVHAAMGVWAAGDTCGRCQRNGVACVARSEFYFCAGERPMTGVKFSCPRAGEVCTNATIVCDEAQRQPASCEDACAAIDFDATQTAFCERQPTVGWYEDDEYKDCNTFYACFHDAAGQLRGLRKRCPAGMSFNRDHRYCHRPPVDGNVTNSAANSNATTTTITTEMW